MIKILRLYKKCKEINTSFLLVIYKYCLHRLLGKNILIDAKTKINGIKNIRTNGLLQIGMSNIGFTHNRDITYLNINGSLITNGNVLIAKGCRFNIAKNAIVEIGSGSYINPFSIFIVTQGLTIGEKCAISWNCQFLDTDFHTLNYDGKKQSSEKITLSDNIWVGSHVSIYKGTYIAKGSVIASNSVVKGVFLEENVLIAGNPAKIIKRNIDWHL